MLAARRAPPRRRRYRPLESEACAPGSVGARGRGVRPVIERRDTQRSEHGGRPIGPEMLDMLPVRMVQPFRRLSGELPASPLRVQRRPASGGNGIGARRGGRIRPAGDTIAGASCQPAPVNALRRAFLWAIPAPTGAIWSALSMGPRIVLESRDRAANGGRSISVRLLHIRTSILHVFDGVNAQPGPDRSPGADHSSRKTTGARPATGVPSFPAARVPAAPIANTAGASGPSACRAQSLAPAVFPPLSPL